MNKLMVLLVLLAGCTTMTEMPKGGEKATFAGGCFWCIEASFEGIDGVMDVVSGYTGGDMENPSYKDVSSGKSGHLEAVQVTFNPDVISYKELLDLFWRQIDPTDDGGQFADRGPQYRTAIFFHDENQKALAEKSKNELEDSGKFDNPIVTEIRPASTFYLAEEHHQDYAQKRTLQYKLYEKASGRKDFKEDVWS
jgi:peptide methionine sulfoxide reductase msrA/msrB